MPRTLPRRILQKLPAAWRAEVEDVPAQPVTSGMSGAEVFRLRMTTGPSRYLKIGEGSVADALRREIARTAWLAERGIPVARILCDYSGDRFAAMQTQALAGRPADRCKAPTEQILLAVADALSRLHALPADDCPFDETLPVRLARAQRDVEAGEVSGEHFASRNRGVAPAVLLARISGYPPAEDIVVAHGDASLSNMIVAPDGRDALACAFIDCGHGGRADRYLDLAVIAAEIEEQFGRRAVAAFAQAYGEPAWNARKAAFYTDLYEFF